MEGRDLEEESTQESCLIPEYIVDPASQRVFLVSIFVVIQCWKIYDILLVKADAFALTEADTVSELPFTSLNNFTFVIKYVVVDGLFLWFLPMLNVPLLSFRPFVTLVLTVLVNMFTFLLASNSAFPLIAGVFVPIWNSVFKHKELTIVGDSVAPQSVMNMNEHFKGKYTIQYLPASSVMLNPFSYENVCLEKESLMHTHSLRLPIEFNTTSDIAMLQIQHIVPSNTITLLNYTAHDISRLMRRDHSHLERNPAYVSNDERVFYLEIDIHKPGKYRIYKVTDTNGMSIRPYKSDFTVGSCPEAKLVYPGLELDYSAIKCVVPGREPDWILPHLSVSGILPLNVELVTKLNGILISRFNASVSGEQRNGLGWLDNQEITRNILEQEVLRNPKMFQIIGSGKFEFRVAGVTDLLGIRREYNPASNDKEIYYPVHLKESAKLYLVDRYPDNPLLNGQVKTLYFETKQKLELPLKVTVQFQDEKVATIKNNLTYVINDAEEFFQGIKVSQPGMYSIVAGQDKFCLCELDKNNVVPISTPKPPTAVISGKTISDKCVGTVGFEFDINFTGRPPFEVQYEIFKNLSGILKPILSERGLRQHLKRSSGDHFRFQYRPGQEGNYILVFKQLKDVNYHKLPVNLVESDNTFSAQFHRNSKFSFFKDRQQMNQRHEICKGEFVVIPVYFEGNFPFQFRYEIVDVNTQKVTMSKKVKDYYRDSYTITSPKFVNGGMFEIVVKDVVDNLGCPVSAVEQESIVVSARTDTPSAAFKKSQTFTIVEGDSVSVPIIVSSSVGSSSDDKIIYSYKGKGEGETLQEYTLRGSTTLQVSETGIYRLVSFENKGCAGTVVDNTVEVLHYPKPRLSIIPQHESVRVTSDDLIQLKPICQGAPRSLKLKLEGQAPFVVTYQIQYPHGSIKSSSMVIEKNEITIPLTLKRKGIYEHSFTGVFDSRYTQEKMRRTTHQFKLPRVQYEVQGSPNLNVEKSYLQLCEAQVSESKFTAPIPLTLKGTYPFKLSGSIKKVNGDVLEKFLVDINNASVDIGALQLTTPVLSLFTVGEYIVTFEEIQDANHCKLTMQNLHTVRVSITQIPTIQKQSVKDYYCVGDHIAYNMSGISPFTLFYKFNGQLRKAEQAHEFIRLASKPGELAIVALKDSSTSLCLVNFTKNEKEYNRLKLEVRELPSVEISHGDNIIKNLHEGDQTEITFKFSGVPPFLVTYVRTLGDEEGQHKRRKTVKHTKARRVVDRKTVKDIWDYEHTEVVGLEGTYEAIMVSDAYCRAIRDVNEIL